VRDREGRKWVRPEQGSPDPGVFISFIFNSKTPGRRPDSIATLKMPLASGGVRLANSTMEGRRIIERCGEVGERGA